MATSVLSRKKGVIVGDDVINLFKYAQEKSFAIPAIVRRLACTESSEFHADTTVERHILVDCSSIA